MRCLRRMIKIILKIYCDRLKDMFLAVALIGEHGYVVLKVTPHHKGAMDISLFEKVKPW